VSLELVVALTLLSRFKFDKLWMTVDFVDLMIIDRDTSAFLLAVFPSLPGWIALAAAGTVAIIIAAWRLDPGRVRVRTSLVGGSLCLSVLVAVSLLFPTDLHEDFVSRTIFQNSRVPASRQHVNSLAWISRSGRQHRRSPDATRPRLAIPCENFRLLFFFTTNPASTFPPRRELEYRRLSSPFSVVGRQGAQACRGGAGGPSWFTEFNVLTGLSPAPLGVYATSVTRIAAGRVSRGCAIHCVAAVTRPTASILFMVPFSGPRLPDHRRYLELFDMLDLGTREFEPIAFYFDQAIRIIDRERGNDPLFLYVYTVANHFPWDTRLRPELTPNWRDLGNAPDVEEYIRRQGMTAQDYSGLLQRLTQNFR
jgi:hypothetical protein